MHYIIHCFYPLPNVSLFLSSCLALTRNFTLTFHKISHTLKHTSAHTHTQIGCIMLHFFFTLISRFQFEVTSLNTHYLKCTSANKNCHLQELHFKTLTHTHTEPSFQKTFIQSVSQI